MGCERTNKGKVIVFNEYLFYAEVELSLDLDNHWYKSLRWSEGEESQLDYSV
jgi:hypothetical protein